ncbi:SDR family oxidoreductase [Vulgatibacter sp.]|uniref:SDR family oxidoreductase n=1 Tax=Vulgatibacter sp. TaxID=1971226 RepID=UPI003561DFE1
MRHAGRKKPIDAQTLVITGASSGIGLATAQIAARRGARVVLSSFDPKPLEEATEALRDEGCTVASFVADVSARTAMERLAAFATRTFGRIDTWVNNAGVHVFGKSLDVDLEDARRVLAVDYWGTVHGSRAALPRLRESRGTLVNVGSVLSGRAVPLQGIYSASKHAVKAWTDALRMELALEGVAVAVTLVQPSAIDTPIVRHSKSLMPFRVQLPPPMYAPEVVGRAIVRAAQRPQRDVTVGGAGIFASIGEKFGPKTADEVMRFSFFRLQRARGPARGVDALHRPLGEAPRKRSGDGRVVLRHSAWTWARQHPAVGGAVAALLGVGLVAGVAGREG